MNNTVVFAIPSKRKPEECQSLLNQWIERGYRVVLRRLNSDAPHPTGCELVLRDSYEGWAASVNELSKLILNRDPEVNWVVTGGDDYAPDLNHTAEEIAEECSTHFGRRHATESEIRAAGLHPAPGIAVKDIGLLVEDGGQSTFGVMQPTGDRWGENDPTNRHLYPDAPALIDRVCGSPWLGREFCLRMYGGEGPMFAGYSHMFADEELQNVAKRLDILWQRRDLTQIHHHWSRDGSTCPDWLKWAASNEHWRKARSLFDARRSAGWSGHEPL